MPWTDRRQTGWGRALSATGQIARPERQTALARLMADTPAPAVGMRRSYGDAALNHGGRACDMTRLDRILDFDPETGIVEVEAGLPIGDLCRAFAGRGWIPPVMPGTGFATVGGCIANDVHGKNHHVMGSFGQHVTEIVLLQGPRRRRITPRSGALWRATLGGLGQTGAIATAKIRLMPCTGDAMVLSERRMPDLDAFLHALDDSRSDYTVGWIDAAATGARLGRGILEEGEIAAGLLPRKPRRGTASVPCDAPGWALSAPVVRGFNTLYYHRIPTQGRTGVKPLDGPFFPLDRIRDWNRLYGKAGFYQFQCVLPPARAEVLRQMLERIGGSGRASPLAVLKKMGAGSGGYLSFPMEGYTLAVDVPNRPGAADLLSELTDMTADAGGRIYFAKDGIATAGQVAGMYPERDKWREAVEKADPERLYETDLVRRLGLRDPERTA
ncbi:FAD-binding oxidoreductase [Celeribacter indicus]|uniref:FAD linked oxidase domain-containing protein n=1 Tax=Celeribacter indicus TaxID=1208324 RepID=A0A0B5DXT6_9RHOB|nr:FAD-binding oxidoreductase [Celeribacter indicus]AJE45935.1 FAD linked oxidase domain-containing protein [Celeribacter indicus]SDW64144.1 decaprenylphospho-beta-D-ribofuranose 2-oxidase [Celeribacter indicus]